MKRLFSAVILFFLANAAILYFALGRFSGGLKYISGGYHMHFIAFFGLSFILSLILVHEKISLPAPFTLCFLYSGAASAIVEVLQLQTGYRVFSYYDILAGSLGALSYSVLGLISYNSKLFHKYWVKI